MRNKQQRWTKWDGRPSPPSPLVEGSLMDGSVGSVEAAGAARYPYIHKCSVPRGENEFPTVNNHITQISHCAISDCTVHLMCSCCIYCLPSPWTPIHKGFHKGGRVAEGCPPPFVEAAEGRLPLWMGVRGLGRQ